MQNVIFLPFAIVLFFIFRMLFKRAVFYHAGRKEWITDKALEYTKQIGSI